VRRQKGRSRDTAETRPTSDLIRGVIFDMLDALGADYSRVLDMYAGTGALGIEALSRADGHADFVERDAEAVAVIRENLERTRFTTRAAVHRIAAERATGRFAPPEPYTLVLADPPYYDEEALKAVMAVAESPLIGASTVFVLEHHRSTAPPERLGPLPLYRSRRHGDTVVSIYAREEEQ
jgi:16S rRNA (guanine966-N2)-methyltransferase